jgi:hypothetical protein
MTLSGNRAYLIKPIRVASSPIRGEPNSRHWRAPMGHVVRHLLFIGTALSTPACAADPAHYVATSAAQAVDWQTSPLDLDLRGMNGERYVFHCPAGKPQPSRITGRGPYTDDSSICTAAVHTGVIHARDGGEVAIEIRPGQDNYPGSEQNYIRSAGYDHAWSGSFVVLESGNDPPPQQTHIPRKP